MDIKWETFRKQVERYRKEEIRAIFYEIAMNILKDKNESDKDLIKAIKIVLLSWNIRPYLGRDMTKEKLENQLGNFLKRNKEEIEILNGQKLENIELSKFKSNILDLYEKLKNLDRIGTTGSSKILHIINKDLFVMWDGYIMGYYHNNHQRHTKGSGECYFKFLYDMQELYGDLVDNLSKNEIKNPKSYILEELSREEYEITIPKILDEYNYIKISSKK